MSIEIDLKDVEEIVDLLSDVGVESWGNTAKEQAERVEAITKKLKEKMEQSK